MAFDIFVVLFNHTLCGLPYPKSTYVGYRLFSYVLWLFHMETQSVDDCLMTAPESHSPRSPRWVSGGQHLHQSKGRLVRLGRSTGC